MNTYSGYIFDLDGTLIDSMGIWEEIDRILFAKRGIALPKDYIEYAEAVVPLSPLESAAYTIRYFGLKETAEEMVKEWNKQAKEAYSSTVPMKPYAKEFLHMLREKGAKMAIASSAPRELCIAALRNHGIEDCFDAICLSEEVGCGKHRPDVFLLAAEKLGTEKCVVFEDNLAAMKTAKGAGMDICAVYDEYSKGDWEEIQRIADYIIYDYEKALTMQFIAES